MQNLKKYIIFIILIIFIFILTGCSNNENTANNSDNTNNNLSASRTSTDVNLESTNNTISNTLSPNESNSLQEESEISFYSTIIKDNSSGRLTNMQITCSTLNGTIIRNGEKFSFNNIVGKPTSEKGYQEASVIIDHKTEKGIGGGNCQVSSTLYNAVLAVNGLQITQRHEHGKDVTYVPDGKDAAVSYGSLDFEFRNNTGYNIKINASCDNSNVYIRLLKVL